MALQYNHTIFSPGLCDYTLLTQIPPYDFQCHIIYGKKQDEFYHKFQGQDFYIPVSRSKDEYTYYIWDINNKKHCCEKRHVISAINKIALDLYNFPSCEKPKMALPIRKIKDYEFNQLYYDPESKKVYNSHSYKEIHFTPNYVLQDIHGHQQSITPDDLIEAIHKILPDVEVIISTPEKKPKPKPPPKPLPPSLIHKDPFEGKDVIEITDKNIHKVKAHLHNKLLFNQMTPQEYDLYLQLEEDSDYEQYEEDESFGHD
jgi:hypothetical protein